ncbi:MAG: anthranilate phosphoribosyltransferase [Planctomycetes bacterium DG_23]|nr:MAG: anthranilate phosphoribosyltransferase [Planctomycetes bacterium DG_23]
MASEQGIKEFLAKVATGEDLSISEARQAMAEIMSGKATPAQIAAYLVALRLKGETTEEITGSAQAMREACLPFECEGPVLDTCGTGGDEVGTFNVSTAGAIVAAACGVKVAKHGNYAVSSASGSADVLKKFGVNIEAPLPVLKRCFDEANIAFLFAPAFHKAMKYAIGPRREIGLRTIFNILGPLASPAKATRHLLGVYNEALAERLAGVFKNLGAEHAWVVHGHDGLDEITITGETRVVEVAEGEIDSFMIEPEVYGISRGRLEDLLVKSVDESAQAIRDVFAGKEGPRRDMVLLNAGGALVVGGRATDLGEGIHFAAEAIDSGKAQETLEKLAHLSQEQTG